MHGLVAIGSACGQQSEHVTLGHPGQKNEACLHWQSKSAFTPMAAMADDEHEIAAPVEAMVALWQMAPVQSGRCGTT
jgi:hypothetical protein